MNFFKAGLAILYVMIAGYGFVRCILKDKNCFSLFGLIPLAFVVGFGLLAWESIVLMLIRLKLSFWLMILPLFPLVIFGLTQIKLTIDFSGVKKTIRSFTWLEWGLIVIILSFSLTVFLMSVTFPLHFWDSRAIWGMKGKMLYDSGTIFSPDFQDPFRIHAHFRYPLLYPLAQAFIFFCVGTADDWAMMILIGLCLPLMGMFLYELIKQTTDDRTKALLSTAVLVTLPVFYMIDGAAHSGYADTLLALFFLVSFGCLLLWRKKQAAHLLLVGSLMSGFLPLIKNEGTMLLFLNLIWIAWPTKTRVDWEQIRSYCLRIGIFIAVVGVIILPWLLLASNLAPANDERYPEQFNLATLSNNLSRLPGIGLYIVKALLGFQSSIIGYYFIWVGMWYLLILSTILAWGKFPKMWGLLSGIIFSFFVCFMIIYWIMPSNGASEITAMMVASFFRVTQSITPLAILLICWNLAAISLPRQ